MSTCSLTRAAALLLFGAWVVTSAGAARPAAGATARQVEPGASLDGSLARGERATVVVQLAEGDLLVVEVEQLEADVSLRAVGPSGVVLGEVDKTLPGSAERLRLVAVEPGLHRLDVSVPSEAAREGRYSVTALEVRRATERDRARALFDLISEEGRLLRLEPSEASREAARGRLGEALLLAWAAEDLSAEADAQIQIGIARYQSGQREASADAIALGADLARLAGDCEALAVAAGNLGFLAASAGDPERAAERAREALHAIDVAGMGYNLRGPVLNNLCFALTELGQLEPAEEACERARAVFAATGDVQGEGVAFRNLGTLAGLRGDPGSAEKLQRRALERFLEIGDRSFEAGARSALAALLRDRGELEAALEEARCALAASRGAESTEKEMWSLLALSSVEVELGRTDDALAHLAEARARTLAFSDDPARVRCATAEARALLGRGELSAARLAIGEALGVTESLREKVWGQSARTTLASAQREVRSAAVEVFVAAAELEPGAGWEAAAFEASESGRARALLDVFAEARARVRDGADPVMLEREREVRRRLAHASQSLSRALSRGAGADARRRALDDVDALSAQLEELGKELRRSSPKFAELTRPGTIGVEEVQGELLDEGTILVAYHLGRRRSVAWVVDRTGLTMHALPDEGEIQRHARAAFEILASGAARARAADLDAALYRLGAAVLEPLGSRLRGERLAVIADGALHYVPFGLLPVPAALDPQRPPLLERYELVSLPSASAVAALRRSARARPPAAGAVAVLADPVFSARDPRLGGRPGASAPPAGPLAGALRDLGEGTSELAFPRLPGTRREAERLLGLAGSRQSFAAFDFDASLATVAAGALRGHRVLHLATHGVLDAARPELSGVVLSLVDREGRPRDGYLLAHDVYALELDADLVVLSGCRTALGRDVRGEGLVGLARAFLGAGVPRVVASLWSVGDEATAELMGRFYRGVLRDGLRPAAALRAAQRAMRAENRFRDPGAWAAFGLHGDFR